MLSIGEFSKICEVSTKTLRYYDEVGLIKPSQINQETGYRYYSIEQLEMMLMINRLKQYGFSLEQIRELMKPGKIQNEKLTIALGNKKKEIVKQIVNYSNMIVQLDQDLASLKQGKSMLSYLDSIDIQLVEIGSMHLVSKRKMVKKSSFPDAYKQNFDWVLKEIQRANLTIVDFPRVLFYSDEFNPSGLDTEFAIPVNSHTTKTREFLPGLCLKTILRGPYSNLSSIYTKQCEWAELNGYENNGPLVEVYCQDPTEVTSEDELVTEIYYPIKKKLVKPE